MFLVDVLGYIMKILYNLCNNYGIAIILFTLISKIILLPVSIIVQKNSIKMVKMIKIKFQRNKQNCIKKKNITLLLH